MLEICMSGSMRGSGLTAAPYSTVVAVTKAAVSRAPAPTAVTTARRHHGTKRPFFDDGPREWSTATRISLVAKKKTVKRRKRIAPRSVGLTAEETATPDGAAIRTLSEQIAADGGAVLGAYRDPFGGTPVLFASLPIDRVEPTPYQRDPSEPHVKRLMNVIETLGRFLDPVICVRQGDSYLTPNGNHRLQAMRKLGARSIIALVVPDPEVAFKILALNTEKAHNLKEKSLETIRMLRALAEERVARDEREFAFEFEQPAFLTLGPRMNRGRASAAARIIRCCEGSTTFSTNVRPAR
jgi:hypothetical protein